MLARTWLAYPIRNNDDRCMVVIHSCLGHFRPVRTTWRRRSRSDFFHEGGRGEDLRVRNGSESCGFNEQYSITTVYDYRKLPRLRELIKKYEKAEMITDITKSEPYKTLISVVIWLWPFNGVWPDAFAASCFAFASRTHISIEQNKWERVAARSTGVKTRQHLLVRPLIL